MNLDSPEQGEKFDYTCAAAVKRTKDEFKKTLTELSNKERNLFLHLTAP